MKYFIFQGNDHDCGFASLKMLLANLSKDKSYLYVPKPDKRENYSLEDIIKIAKDYGLELEAYSLNKQGYDELQVPCLSLIDNNHVVMIKKVRKNSIVIYDPGRGKIKMKKDEFLRRWRNIILEKSGCKNLDKIKRIRQRILPIKLNVFEAIFSLASTAILIGAFYLLNKTENMLYSLVFLLLFILSLLFEKLILYKQVYTFDSIYIPIYFGLQKNQNENKYKQFIEFKQTYFTSNRELISSITMMFLISFLLIINDTKNIFVLLAFLLIKTLGSFLFFKRRENVKNLIADEERKAIKIKEDCAYYALKANRNADQQILTYSLKTIFYVFVSFAFAFLMMSINGASGCNYVIFYFALYYTSSNSINAIVDGLSNKKETDKLERRFFDSCNL